LRAATAAVALETLEIAHAGLTLAPSL
jgi:hypothetical protein